MGRIPVGDDFETINGRPVAAEEDENKWNKRWKAVSVGGEKKENKLC
jgi:hypothetical protein